MSPETAEFPLSAMPQQIPAPAPRFSPVSPADANAPECTDVPVCVQGFVAINFVVKIGYASEVIWVSVKK